MKPEANKTYIIERVTRNNRAEDADEQFDREIELVINRNIQSGYDLHSFVYQDRVTAILVFKSDSK